MGSVRCRYSKGFTLVELLVVIAIIGILIALLLPAVQAAREAARRSTCTNQVKQIGLAMHNYHDVNRQFPPAAIYQDPLGAMPPLPEAGQGRNANFGATWVLMLLPYIEQKPLYDQYNTRLPSLAGNATTPNISVGYQLLPGLICPTHERIQQSWCLNQNPPVTANPAGLSKITYGACTGGGRLMNVTDFGNQTLKGAFHPYRQYGATFADIRDGTSNVIVLSEIVAINSGGDSRGAWNWFNGPLFCGQATCGGTRIFTPNTKQYWDCAPFAANNLANPVINERDDPDGAGDTTGQGARSYHPGGVMAGLGDASVRFLSETIDQTLYLNALAIQDGNPVSLP